jgi:hypothetical protein
MEELAAIISPNSSIIFSNDTDTAVITKNNVQGNYEPGMRLIYFKLTAAGKYIEYSSILNKVYYTIPHSFDRYHLLQSTEPYRLFIFNPEVFNRDFLSKVDTITEEALPGEEQEYAQLLNIIKNIPGYAFL